MQWIPSLVTSAGVIVTMITLGWRAYSKLDSKFDALREEMQAGFREVDRQFEEMITAMDSASATCIRPPQRRAKGDQHRRGGTACREKRPLADPETVW